MRNFRGTFREAGEDIYRGLHDGPYQPTPVMLKTLLLILPLLTVPAQAAVIISEVLFNEVSTDTSGE